MDSLKINAISKIRPFFDDIHVDIPNREIYRLLDILKPKKLKKGEHFLSAGELNYSFCFVSKGLLRVYYITSEGNEYTVTFKDENKFLLSYYTVMVNKPSNFYVDALEDSEILVGDFRELEKFYAIDPVWNEIARKFYEINFMIKVEREERLLLLNAKDRYIDFAKNNPTLIKRLSQKLIAQYLGITPISLNRIIKDLRETR